MAEGVAGFPTTVSVLATPVPQVLFAETETDPETNPVGNKISAEVPLLFTTVQPAGAVQL